MSITIRFSVEELRNGGRARMERRLRNSLGRDARTYGRFAGYLGDAIARANSGAYDGVGYVYLRPDGTYRTEKSHSSERNSGHLFKEIA